MTQPHEISQTKARQAGLRVVWRLAALAGIASIGAGCATVEYAALEKVGIHKRDILVDRVEDAREAQSDTRERLVSAYDELSALIGHEGGELQDQYDKLSKSVDRSRKSRDRLDDRLEAIDEVSEDLFEEWEEELELYTSDSLRADQQRKLQSARGQYAAMRQRMQVARDRVDPVMRVLEDNVLFLKHSLNASALAALRGQASELEGEVDRLIADMQAAIDEADRFIANMRS